MFDDLNQYFITARGGSGKPPPPHLGHPVVTIMREYLYVLPLQVIPRHRNASRSPWGAGGASGMLAFFVFLQRKSKKKS